MNDPHPYPPGTATPAGWSFLAEPPLTAVAVPAGFVVEIAIDTTGFRVAGRLEAPATVAKLIAAVKDKAQQPIVLITRGSVPTGTAADLLFGALADSLASPVIAADGAVWATAHGILSTAGHFRRWRPRGADAPRHIDTSPRHRVVGNTTPPPLMVRRRPSFALTPDPPAPESLPPTDWVSNEEPTPQVESVALGAEDFELLEPRRWSRPWTAVTAPSISQPLAEQSPTAVPTSAASGIGVDRKWSAPVGPATALDSPRTEPLDTAWSPSSPLWIVDGAWSTEDRTTLRRLLSDRYDGYARVVVRTLAEQPGLRGAKTSADLVADLVALLAYHARERDAVNGALRTGRSQGADDREAFVARGAAHALRRLPAVLGPVFAAGCDAAPVLAGYRAGVELVEPAFVDVAVARSRVADATIEFVIWSVSARRLDRVGSDSAYTAVFPPGSRFTVLAVDPPSGDGPTRVLLQDRAGDRPGGEDRVLDRLRGAALNRESERPLRVLAFAPGLDDRGRRFVPPPAGIGAGADNLGRARA